ncbi:MAG: transcriptional repressor LexA [Firmicutes bacterium]|nr:transcriptional repressor LexA [Bacillota bacterium]
MSKLTKRQQEIFDFIVEEVREKGYPPSVREIGKAVGLKSSSTVHGHLSRLEEKGLIRRDPTKPRAIEILGMNKLVRKETINVPIVGNVTAGEPILAHENIEDYFPIPADFVSSEEELFMLHIQGDSMIEAGILDGDYVLVRRQPSADNGDIVVALIGEDSTVKRFFKEDGYYRLQPENPAMEPIIVQEVEILGKVVGVFRRLH